MGRSRVAEWTTEAVAARFAEAAETGRRLPRVNVQGYFNVWPAFAREVWESYPDTEPVYRPWPPTPQAIDRMLETMRWVLWLEEGQRHLVWMRAKDIDWKVIARRLGCHRTTAWRAWQTALNEVAAQLNAGTPIGSVVQVGQDRRGMA
ncbi:MAG: helix-turn-helix domain-containing protein [Sulfuritalea sp.]|nr:helix-turn-helix domain-containing protein [Sulfuritalea sp.]